MDSEAIVTISFVTISTGYLAYLWLKYATKTSRRYYCRPDNLDRPIFGFYETAFQAIKLNEEHFFKYTRMSADIYDVLFSLMHSRLKNRKTYYTISPEGRLALTLSYLSQGVSHEFLGWSFKVVRTTARKIILDTCADIWAVLSPIYVSEPNKEDYKLISRDFLNTWNLPHCLGSIDGKHIAIQNPANSGSNFYNYKKFFSLVLLATCDAKYMFTTVDIGAYGSQSDGGVLNESNFGKKLLKGKLDLPSKSKLSNSSTYFPYFFVGDAAFPLRENLMRPYPGKSLSLDKKVFNYWISRARVVIENTFGILVARWRILRTTLNCAPENVEKIVLACVALHNFIKMNNLIYSSSQYCPASFIYQKDELGNIIPGGWRQEVTGSIFEKHNTSFGSNNSKNRAFHLRDTLKKYFENEGSILKQPN